jgi:hypothetical protein
VFSEASFLGLAPRLYAVGPPGLNYTFQKPLSRWRDGGCLALNALFSGDIALKDEAFSGVVHRIGNLFNCLVELIALLLGSYGKGLFQSAF